MIEKNDFNLKIYKLNDKISKIENKPSLSKIKKEGLLELGKLCLSDLGNDIYQKEIVQLRNYDSDEEYGSTLNYLSARLHENGILFLFCLDWKAGIFDFENLLNRSLEENFSHSLKINLSEKYSERASISYNGVFLSYNKSLKSDGFELTILDTDNDSYTIFVSKLSDNEKIKNLIERIGFKKLKIENGL